MRGNEYRVTIELGMIHRKAVRAGLRIGFVMGLIGALVGAFIGASGEDAMVALMIGLLSGTVSGVLRAAVVWVHLIFRYRGRVVCRVHSVPKTNVVLPQTERISEEWEIPALAS